MFKKTLLLLVLALAALLVLTACQSKEGAGQKGAPGQEQAASKEGGKTGDNVALYKGSDRQKVLEEGARKEGELNIYSAMNSKDSKPLTDAFMKKYPFIKVNLYAATGEEVSQRLLTEQKNNKFFADTFDAPIVEVEKLRRENLVTKFFTPAQDSYPKEHISPDGLWVPIYHNIFTLVYNTNEVKDPPKTYEELLDPKWKGKMALEQEDYPWLINLWELWGEQKARDYFTKLGQQNLLIRKGHSVMMQALDTGEIPLTPTQYLHQAIAEKAKGAPIGWTYTEPMVDMPEGLTLLKKAPHPNAALLYIDFATSKEGQELIFKRGRNVAYPGMDEHVAKAKLLVDKPAATLDKYGTFTKLYEDLLLKPGKK